MHLLLTIFTAFIDVINVSLGRFIQPLEQPFVVQVLSILLIHASFVIIDGVFVIRVACCSRRLLVGQIGVILVSLFQLTLLLQVDDFRVVDADGAPECLGPYHFINQVHRLGRQLDSLDRLLFSLVWVKEADSVWILVVESCGRDHFDSLVIWIIGGHLGFGAHRDDALIIEPCSGHRAFILTRLEFCHGLVLLDTSEEILIRDSVCWINPGLCLSLVESQIVHFSCSHGSLRDNRINNRYIFALAEVVAEEAEG